MYLSSKDGVQLVTGLIQQSPLVNRPPPNGHIALPAKGERMYSQSIPPGNMVPGNHMAPPPNYNYRGKKSKSCRARSGQAVMGLPPPMPAMPMFPIEFGEGVDPSKSDLQHMDDKPVNHCVVEGQKARLTDFHLLLCSPMVRGFCLREQEWGMFLSFLVNKLVHAS